VSVAASLLLAMSALLLAQSPVRRTADIYLPAVELLPRVQAEAIMPATVLNRDDEEVAFAALVTADGYLEDVELIGDRTQGRRHSLPTHAELSELLNAVATARFEPARAAGAPVSQNVVWLVSHTTVRAPLRAYIHVRVDGWKML
jgi:hypothetical protein